ncbi:MAG: hypothetical protein WCA58_12365 [Terriglobales bacterium]
MKPVSARMQLWLIAGGYAAVIVVSAILLLGRYFLEIAHPADVSGARGMYAAGDLMLFIFIAFLFTIPTFFLLWVLAKFERPYTTYSQLLLLFSLSAPVSLALLNFGLNRVPQSLGFLCLYRLFWSPLIVLGIIVSRLVAKFATAKKLTSYALIVEALTLGTAVALLFKRH